MEVSPLAVVSVEILEEPCWVYDIEVEEDASFICRGAVLHNSAICRARDGKMAPVGGKPLPKGAEPLKPPSARPPGHPNCRSVITSVVEDAERLGERPANPTTEKMLLREYTKAEGLDPVTKRSDLPRGHKGAFDRYKRGRVRELIGRVPATDTYQTWLTRQSAEFQDDVLGKTRGRLFRKGGLKLDRFVDREGNEYTLDELRRRDAEAFERAGL